MLKTCTILLMTKAPKVYQQGFSAGSAKSSPQRPNTIYRPAGYDVWLMEYTVKGGARVKAVGEFFVTGPGDLLMFRPGVKQDYMVDPGVNYWEHYWACFTPRAHWQELLSWPEVQDGVFLLHLEDSSLVKKMTSLFKKMEKIFAGPLPRRRDFAMNRLEEVLLHCDTVNPESASAATDERIARVLEYICENHRENISVDELAGLVSLSASRFAHLFQEQTGYSPLQYLAEYRIARARDLLVMTSRTVSEIAYEVGYDNPLYFSRVFSRYTGSSPRQYRQRYS